MKIKGILFDKDGTLIDFYEVWMSATKKVVSTMLDLYKIEPTEANREAVMRNLGIYNEKIDASGSLASKSYPEIAQDLLPVIEDLAGYSIDCKELTMFLIASYRSEVSEKRQEYPVFTDLTELFRILKDRGIQIGIATTDEKDSALTCMKKLGIDSYISFWGTAGGKYPTKPAKELLQQAAREWNINSSEIAVVGDTPNDMIFAKNADAVGIAVLSGTGGRDDLRGVADYIIPSVNELLTVLI